MFHFLDATRPLIEDGAPRFGHFADALAALDRDAFDYRTPFGDKSGALSRWIGCKDFQYLGGMSDRLIFGCALAHLRYMGIAFVYVYDVHTRRLWSRSWRSPLGAGLSLADNPLAGESRFRLPGLVDIVMRYNTNPRDKTLTVRCRGLQLEARMPEEHFRPLSICTRTGYSGWTYACKSAGQPLFGFIEQNGERFDLGELGAHGHHDFSCGYMRRETWWNWACLSGEIRNGEHAGRRVGLNISAGVNETGFSENCYWLDGEVYPLNFTRFRFDSARPLQPWRIESDQGALHLDFTPYGMHHERIRTGLVNSNFRQVFGEFQGELVHQGQRLRLDGLKGFVEDQYIKW